MEDIVLAPADFVALVNQTLDFAYPKIIIEGELSNFRVSKNRWVYFDLKDEFASVSFFGTVYMLPGPLQDGLMVRAVGNPRLHPRFGFSVNLQSISPVGEGSLKKAADLLRRKLEVEGLFAPERKRPLPLAPQRVGLITAASSAAYADFVKILAERWGGVEILLADVFVQGEQAAGQIVQAIDYFNKRAEEPEVLVITRGGGSAEDLAAFNDERVVRAIAASRTPTLVAIGHEVDISLAELAADFRASTPTNAASALVPDKKHELANLAAARGDLHRTSESMFQELRRQLEGHQDSLRARLRGLLNDQTQKLSSQAQLIKLLDPKAALRRGYAIVSKGTKHISSIAQIKTGDSLSLQIQDGTIQTDVKGVSARG